MPQHKKWTFAFLSTLIGAILFVIGFNFQVDSLSLFHNPSHQTDKAAAALAEGKMIVGWGNFNDRHFRESLIRHESKKIDVLAIGSSRIMMLRKSFFHDDNISFANQFVTSARLEDLVALVGIYKKLKGYIPRTVVIGIDPWIFKNDPIRDLRNYYKFMRAEMGLSPETQGRDPDKDDLDKRRWRQLFNLDYFLANYRFKNKSNKYQGNNFHVTETTESNEIVMATDGSVYAPRRDPASVENLAVNIKTGDVGFMENHPALLRIPLFEKFIHYLQANGVTVIFFLPPYHPKTYDLLMTDSKFNIVDKSEQYLLWFARQHGLIVYGSYNPHVIGLLGTDFWDSSHLLESGMEKVAQYQLSLPGEIHRSASDRNDPSLVEENYREYSILEHNGRFYGVPDEDFVVARETGFKGKISDSSIDGLKAKIDNLPPDLVEAGYKCYNIVRHAGVYYGINQSKSSVGVRDIQERPELAQLSGDSIEKVKAKIDNLPPSLVWEDYKGFNVVEYQSVFYGVHQAEGHLDVREVKTKAKLPWVIGNSIADVKSKIDALPPQFLQKSFMTRITNRIKKVFAG